MICLSRVLLLFLSLLGMGTAAAKDNVSYPNAAVPGLTSSVTIYAGIFRPKGGGPFPTVIILHGCGGHDHHHQAWAERLVTWGYVGVVVDSFGSRGHGSVCKRTDVVTPQDRISDIIGTVEYLQKLPYVAKDQIGLLGFSHGGWTVMKAVQEDAYLKSYGIKGAVAYYPYCHPTRDTKVDMPLLVLIGNEDTATPPDLCRQLRDNKALKSASTTEMVFYDGAYHSFDRVGRVIETDMWAVGGGLKKSKIGYDKAAAEDSFRRTREFFDRVLKQ